MSSNIPRKEKYTQVCVWPGTLVGQDKIEEFEEHIFKELGTKVQYLEEIKTLPDEGVEETGDRNDLFFAVHEDDVGKFALPRLQMGIRWIEDVLDKGNYTNKIYPKRVFEYCSWKA